MKKNELSFDNMFDKVLTILKETNKKQLPRYPLLSALILALLRIQLHHVLHRNARVVSAHHILHLAHCRRNRLIVFFPHMNPLVHDCTQRILTTPTILLIIHAQYLVHILHSLFMIDPYHSQPAAYLRQASHGREP